MPGKDDQAGDVGDVARRTSRQARQRPFESLLGELTKDIGRNDDDGAGDDLGNEVDGVLSSTVCLFVPFLASKTANFRDRHAMHTLLGQGVLHFFQFEMPNNGLDLLHQFPSLGLLERIFSAGAKRSLVSLNG